MRELVSARPDEWLLHEIAPDDGRHVAATAWFPLIRRDYRAARRRL